MKPKQDAPSRERIASRTPARYNLIVQVALAIALLTAVADLPSRWAYIESILPVVQHWSNPDEQYRLQITPAPYDLLKRANEVLPRDATVLLVTSGREVAGPEYITYHRALYFLAPRPVWWLTAAPPDGSWKSRWWISAPLTPDSIRATAADKRASYVLTYRLHQPLAIGREVVGAGDGALLRLDDAAQPLQNNAPLPLSPIWPLQVAASLFVVALLGSMVVTLIARLGHCPSSLEAIALAWVLGVGLISVLMLWLSALRLSLDWQVATLTTVAAIWGIGLAWKLWYKGKSVGRGQTQERILSAEKGSKSGYLEQADGAALSDDVKSRPSAAQRLKSRATGKQSPPARTASTEWDTSLRRETLLKSSPRLQSPGGDQVLRQSLRWLLLLFLAVQTVFVAVSATGRPLQVWDSWANWAIKARIIFLEGHISPALYADASRVVTQLDYPLLVPLTQTWLYAWLGAPDDRLVGTISVLFYLALLAICYTALASMGLSRTTALAAVTVAGTISYIPGLAGIVFAELPLLVFATVAGIYLVKWLDGGAIGALLAAAVGAGLMPWTKREGALLLIALCVGTLITNLGSRRAWAGVGALVASAGLLSGPWYGFVAANQIVNPAFSPISLDTLSSNLSRWDTIVQATWNSLTSPLWSYIWPLALVVGLLTWRSHRKRAAANLLPVTALLYIIMVGATFFFSAFVPYEQHILSSIDRLIAQVAPLAVIWLASRAAPLVRVDA